MILFILNSLLLGAGLAMDAFSVSVANGLMEPRMSRRKMFLIAGCYAGFQFAMPLAGWLFVRTIVSVFSAFENWIPYIALALLLYIGGTMLYEGLRGGGAGEAKPLTASALIVQGIATSIDALSAGFTIASYRAGMAVFCAVLIAAVTFAICMGGLTAGKKFGAHLSGKAQILGGVILIGIGLEIFIKGMVL